jgi:hypothetical protein
MTNTSDETFRDNGNFFVSKKFEQTTMTLLMRQSAVIDRCHVLRKNPKSTESNSSRNRIDNAQRFFDYNKDCF